MKRLLKIIALVMAMTFVFCACGTETTLTSNTSPAGETDGTFDKTYTSNDDVNAFEETKSEKEETKSEKEETKFEKVETQTKKEETQPEIEEAQTEKEETQRVKFTMDSGGSFIVELYPEYAPKTVENFVDLVSIGFYDGLTFHRIVDDFMAQGGDPQGDGTGGSPKKIKGEFSVNGFTQNTLSHTRGVISMARSSNYNSASSQFFICYGDATFLDGQYAAFGRVVEGMEVVDSFLEIERVMGSDGAQSRPIEPIVIEKAEVL